uniref:Kinesin motor domain-containing protein n=1 Tax=Globisporangium ultimum (strain ATCC 200006 / CBS 805.95 / DAOM BR144) TaxID=431595 RepID=K3X5Z8_GLOUD
MCFFLQVVKVDDEKTQVYVCKRKNETEIDRELRCTYDRVFDPSATQQHVFDYLQDSVQQVAQGFNCTIFAYGQTGTGKTHTML